MAKKLDRMQLAERRRKVVDYHLKGWEQAAIGRVLGISQASVSRDLVAVEEEWRDAGICDFNLARSREIKKLDLVEREAWAAWQRSQTSAGAAVVTETAKEQKTRKSLRDRYGDARFLDVVSKCVTQRCILMGLQPSPATSEGEIDGGVSLELRREQVFSILTELGERERAGETGAETGDGQPGGAGVPDQQREVAPGEAPLVPRPAAPAGP